MPELLRLDRSERLEWLRSYQQTFLERDLADLVRLDDLHPFRSLQRLVMLRSGQLVAYSELGRDAAVSASTTKRYLRYLHLSFQLLVLQPFSSNLTSRTIKTPKLYWTDLGLLRQGTNDWDQARGAHFETLVVTEIHKLLQTTGDNSRMTFYRTSSGREIDLILESHGLLAIEIKKRREVGRGDTRGLRALANALRNEGPDSPNRWRGGMVVTQGGTVQCLDPELDIWQLPAHRLLS